MSDSEEHRSSTLQALWHEAIDRWATGAAQLPGGRKLIASGAEPRELAAFARAVAYETAFSVLVELDGAGYVPGLYEDLLTADPSGRDGADTD